MTLLELAKGKKILVKTEVGIDVELTIDRIEKIIYLIDLEPPSMSNDWWPPSRDLMSYDVFFTNGYSKNYNNLDDIKFIN